MSEKTSYYGYKVGDVVTTTEDSFDYDRKIPAGTEVKIWAFPPKVRKSDKTDRNSKGHLRDLFVAADTVKDNFDLGHGRTGKLTARVNLNKISKPIRFGGVER
jgi:hypothetical protein